MPEVSREEQVDVLIGRAAVERKLITEVQLREALAEQALGVTRGRARPRRLGAILASQKALSDAQVVSLEQEVEKKIVEQESWQEQDMLFGQILANRELARAEEIEECMSEQAEAIQRGDSPVPLLGELLVERGFVTEDQVAQVLSIQERVILTCSSCGRRRMIPSTEEESVGKCDECGGRLDNLFASDLSTLGTRPPPRPAPAKPEVPSLGKYTLHREIGSGRMGAVYEAIDTQLNRKVALKFILAEMRGEDSSVTRMVERFGVEAEMAARLPKHPHVVSVYEAGEIDGRHFIAMELVQGKSMARWQRENTPSVRRQLRLLRDVAAAVEFAHGHGVLHRDLKPQNVMVDPDDQPFVTDFGLAQAFGGNEAREGTVLKGIAGTPRYMSPEQARGSGQIDRRSDVFSLGVMLYEILTGRPPFQGNSPLDTRNKILNDPVPPIGSRIRGLPRNADASAIEAICRKALAKKPEVRMATAGTLSQELGKWLRSMEPAAAAPKRKPMPTWWILAGVGALLAVTIPLLVVATSSTSLDNRIRKAVNLLNTGRVDEAFAAYEALLKAYPDDARIVRGWYEARLRREGAARADALYELERALLDSGSPSGEVLRALDQLKRTDSPE